MQYANRLIEFFFQTPLLWLTVLVLPLWISARRWQVHPSPRLLGLAAIPAISSLMLVWIPGAVWTVLALDLILIVIAAWDWSRLPAESAFKGTRVVQRVASIGQPHEVKLTVANADNHGYWVQIRDDRPEEFESAAEEFSVLLAARSLSSMDYRFRSNRRGKFEFKSIFLRIVSPWRLWNAYVSLPVSSEVHVYPDLKQITDYELLAKANRLNVMGFRKTRKIGQDHDFERLRDYNQDDNYRNIDWRASARRQKLTVKDFQASQSQRLIFLVDCGRMMTNRSEQLTLLDYSLNAMLMLSYIALQKGDSVGLISFSDRIHHYVPPKSGTSQMNRLLHASFDQHARLVESRYDQAFFELRSRCPKRSLVVLMTNLIDEINANQVGRYLRSMAGRHLPLGVFLRDHPIFAPLLKEAWAGDEIYEAAAAAEIVCWRQQVISDLQHQGVLALDTFPEDLTAGLVNQYLQIKARHLL